MKAFHCYRYDEGRNLFLEVGEDHDWSIADFKIRFSNRYWSQRYEMLLWETFDLIYNTDADFNNHTYILL